MPVAGITLPLLSYGGTSVVVTMIALGILQNIQEYIRRKIMKNIHKLEDFDTSVAIIEDGKLNFL